MRLTSAERQTLLGPLVVGCLLGAFAAFVVAAFHDEHRAAGMNIVWKEVVPEAMLYAAGCAGTVFALLGVFPVLVHRVRPRGRRDV